MISRKTVIIAATIVLYWICIAVWVWWGWNRGGCQAASIFACVGLVWFLLGVVWYLLWRAWVAIWDMQKEAKTRGDG